MFGDVRFKKQIIIPERDPKECRKEHDEEIPRQLLQVPFVKIRRVCKISLAGSL